ncbi:uncharacterized protein F4822DRAFT_417290 [Hypoxylon trugodes]|uniref:uncharacterized protein n=1 Tax=Hypoxylon trugodes TaxID=326681 RepID=UPI002194F5E6|nr:uncharacterized protein F4822DRAFT_417290 [Hypoxylon trugodes]KAI1385097.1 hypothetical protein F4822DRAFT_417290 [Hypoxylon trugodes]
MRPYGVPNTPSSSKVPLNGVFRNGVWQCNCIPRLPAVQFTVRKNTPNKGRVFYICQKDRDKKNKCDFFLWSEDAHEREMGAVLSNMRSEAEESPSHRAKRQRTLHESITPATEKRTEKTPVTSLAQLDRMLNPETPSTSTRSSTMKANTSSVKEPITDPFKDDEDELISVLDAASQQNTPSASAGSKRKRSDVEEFSDFSSGEEEELITIANKSAAKSEPQNKRRNAFETPAMGMGRTYAVDDGMATPLTEKPVRRVLFADPENNANVKREPRTGDSFTSIPASSLAAQSTPTSSSQISTPSSSQQSSGVTITQEVMSLLEGQILDAQVLRTVRGVLDKHAARARDLERGRDASREAVKKAEAHVATLQERVAGLENSRRLDAEARQKTRSEIMKLYRES